MESALFAIIRGLVASEDILFSEHAVRELSADGILVTNLLERVAEWAPVEEYPDYFKGPCILLLAYDDRGMPVHMVWGIPTGASRPAVLVTAYRPDPARWSGDYLQRRKK